MNLTDFIASNNVDQSRDTISASMIRDAEKAVGVQFGDELTQYLLKYGKYIPHDATVKMFLNHITEEKAKLIELPNL